MPATEDLRRSLEARLEELGQEATKLRKALDALDGKPAKPKLGLSKKQAKGARATLKSLGPRWIEVVPAGKLITILKGSEGISAPKARQGDRRRA
jgi:hypothetical protein